jgi:hypothetical protein
MKAPRLKKPTKPQILIDMLRAHFERGPDMCRTITTIAPTPTDGKTLKQLGWRWCLRDENGKIIKERDPDEVRLETLRFFGHKEKLTNKIYAKNKNIKH